MPIGSFSWLVIIQNCFKWIWQSYLDYKRRVKLRQEAQQQAKADYEKAKVAGDMGATLDALMKGKGKNE